MTKKIDLSIYLIIDPAYLKKINRSWKSVLVPALEAGATAVQLRCKDLNEKGFIALARKIKKITDKYRVPLIINDNVMITKKINTRDAHVGSCDMPVREARKLLGPEKIIGVSASTEKEALLVSKEKADYLGLGPVYRTENKKTPPLKASALKRIMKKMRLPVVAIGGIKEYNIPALKKAGVKNFCFISEISAAKNVMEKTTRLKELIK